MLILSDVVLETARALVLAVIVGYLLRYSRKGGLRSHPGLLYMISGFALVLFAAAIDITDNFENLNPYIVVGDTQYQAFLEKVVGYLFGFSLLALGFWRWLPEVAARRRAETALRSANGELERRNVELADARDEAATDGLTGLGNHRAFHAALRAEVSKAESGKAPVGLIMLDIDNFKAINDRQGHPAGDKVLQAVARVLVTQVGQVAAYRYGGDEFALLLPGLNTDEAASLGEQTQQSVLADAACRSATVTATLGVASFPESGGSAEELLYRADSAMYSAKALGKNRVGVWSGPADLDAAA